MHGLEVILGAGHQRNAVREIGGRAVSRPSIRPFLIYCSGGIAAIAVPSQWTAPINFLGNQPFVARGRIGAEEKVAIVVGRDEEGIVCRDLGHKQRGYPFGIVIALIYRGREAEKRRVQVWGNIIVITCFHIGSLCAEPKFFINGREQNKLTNREDCV